MPNALSNQIFAQFWPPLSDEANYVPARGGDQLCFRRVVALSFAVSYAFGLGSLLTMPLCMSRLNAKAAATKKKD